MQQSCIPLRNLRYLRENNMQAYFINLQKNPMCLPLISQIIADKTQTTNPKTTLTPKPPKPVFLCEIIQPAVFLCVICAICGRITRKSTQSILHQTKPQCLSQITQIIAAETIITIPGVTPYIFIGYSLFDI